MKLKIFSGQKKEPVVERKPLPPLEEVIGKGAQLLPPSVTQKPDVQYDPTFMETTRTFSRRIREYWKL